MLVVRDITRPCSLVTSSNSERLFLPSQRANKVNLLSPTARFTTPPLFFAKKETVKDHLRVLPRFQLLGQV